MQFQVVVKDQLLLYIKGESDVGKCCIIQALELRFTFLSRQAKLVIPIPTNYIANRIERSTIHITLNNNTRADKSFIGKINTL